MSKIPDKTHPSIVMEPIKSSKVDISVNQHHHHTMGRKRTKTRSQAPLAMGPGGLVVSNLGVLRYNDGIVERLTGQDEAELLAACIANITLTGFDHRLDDDFQVGLV